MLFDHTIANATKSDKLEVRLKNLNKFFTYFLYCNICRSLFEKDKLLFAFTLCATILQYQDKMDPAEFRFLVTGGVADEDPPPKPVPWQTDKLWDEACRLSRLNDHFKVSGSHPTPRRISLFSHQERGKQRTLGMRQVEREETESERYQPGVPSRFTKATLCFEGAPITQHVY